jgi:hypothetical protein
VVETLSAQLPVPVIDAGLQLTCMPAGIPLSARPTVPVNPPIAAMLTVKVVLLPAVRVCELGEVEIEKSGGGLFVLNTTLTVVLWLRVPLAPAMVRV